MLQKALVSLLEKLAFFSLFCLSVVCFVVFPLFIIPKKKMSVATSGHRGDSLSSIGESMPMLLPGEASFSATPVYLSIAQQDRLEHVESDWKLKGKNKRKKERVVRNVEDIICQGKDTVIPKSRSSAERRYFCNGHPIHRVTFWRHRKHGCPHNEVDSSNRVFEGTTMEGGISKQPLHASKKTKMDKPSILAVQAAHVSNQGFMSNSMSSASSMLPSNVMLTGMPMSYPALDASITENVLQKHQPVELGVAPMSAHTFSSDIAPGNMPSQLDSMSLASQVGSAPVFMGQIARSLPSSMANPSNISIPSSSNAQRFDMMPPFSFISDSLNLYYAPYRAPELEEEDVSSPINATPFAVNSSGSPYQSDRSEASDFLDESDMVFNSYLERNE